MRVCGIGPVDVEILAVRREDGESPRAARVVPDRDARHCRFASADHVPARRDEVNPVAQRWDRLRAMWVVGHHGAPAQAAPSAHDPVVATGVATFALARRRGERIRNRREMLIAPVVRGPVRREIAGLESNRRAEGLV